MGDGGGHSAGSDPRFHVGWIRKALLDTIEPIVATLGGAGGCCPGVPGSGGSIPEPSR